MCCSSVVIRLTDGRIFSFPTTLCRYYILAKRRLHKHFLRSKGYQVAEMLCEDSRALHLEKVYLNCGGKRRRSASCIAKQTPVLSLRFGQILILKELILLNGFGFSARSLEKIVC